MQSRLLKNILSVSGVLILVKALGFFQADGNRRHFWRQCRD